MSSDNPKLAIYGQRLSRKWTDGLFTYEKIFQALTVLGSITWTFFQKYMFRSVYMDFFRLLKSKGCSCNMYLA